MKRAYLIGIASVAFALATPAAIAQVSRANGGANGAQNGAANGAGANHEKGAAKQASRGIPPQRGSNTKIGGEPLPSQRLTTTGGG